MPCVFNLLRFRFTSMNKAASELGKLKAGVREKPSSLKKVTSAENGKLGGRPKGSFKCIKPQEVLSPFNIIFSNGDE